MADGGVALIVDGAVGEVELFQEAPDVAVRPVEERVHSHERCPARAARRKTLLEKDIVAVTGTVSQKERDLAWAWAGVTSPPK